MKAKISKFFKVSFHVDAIQTTCHLDLSRCPLLHKSLLPPRYYTALVLMTRDFDYCPSASEGDNQSVRSSAPVVSRYFPGGYNVKLYISRGRLASWLLAFLHSVTDCKGSDTTWELRMTTWSRSPGQIQHAAALCRESDQGRFCNSSVLHNLMNYCRYSCTTTATSQSWTSLSTHTQKCFQQYYSVSEQFINHFPLSDLLSELFTHYTMAVVSEDGDVG